MSLFKFGNLEAEIDFTDADFWGNLEEAKQLLEKEVAMVPKTGKASDIIRAQCWCYFNFFDRIIGEGAHEDMFCGKTSLKLCLEAGEALAEFDNAETENLTKMYSGYAVQQHGNRSKRRNYNKQQKRNNQNYRAKRNG